MTADGKAQGYVSGPRIENAFAELANVVELVHCLSLDDAFAAGIRMANKNDTDLVISGNAALWCSKWGTLERSSPSHVTVAGR